MIVKDQMNRVVEIKQYPPKRIISLVPSITELLAYLNLEQELVGITKFCIHPEYVFKSKERIGGTKNLNIEKIKQLNPDLIIGNKEENVKEQIEELSKYSSVWMSDVNTYSDALDMIQRVGEITNRKELSYQLVLEIQEEFDKLKYSSHLLKDKKVLYLIWYQPYMAVGGNTYINDIILKTGAVNALSDKSRYVEISIEDILQMQPDYVLLSSEPFPFKEKHKAELHEKLHSNTKVILVNGEMFSWYGVKMKELPGYLKQIPEI